MSRRAWYLALVSSALVLLGADVAPATTVAHPVAPTSVREHQGTIVFSQYDPAAGTWSLFTRARNAQPQRVPVPASPTPFDADIGTDTRGRPALVYERCLGFGEIRTETFTTTGPTACDLYVYSLSPGGSEHPVRNANDPARDDMNPTIWRGRIAWSRRHDNGDIVYTKTLTAPRSRPSTRLPGVPRQRCLENPRRCATTADRGVTALELRDELLALAVTYTCRGCGGIAESQLRLDDIREGTAQRIWRSASGMSGRMIVGPSLSRSTLGWYFGCAVDEPSCAKDSGPYRYTLSNARYTRASGPIVVGGFADAGAKLYEVEVRGCMSPPVERLAQEPSTATCRIEELAAPSYAPTGARL